MHPATIGRSLVQVGPYHFMGGRSGMAKVTAHLLSFNVNRGIVTEPPHLHQPPAKADKPLNFLPGPRKVQEKPQLQNLTLIAHNVMTITSNSPQRELKSIATWRCGNLLSYCISQSEKAPEFSTLHARIRHVENPKFVIFEIARRCH